MSERDNAIKRLTLAINANHKCDLTNEQVEHWIGSDTSITTIIDDCHDTESAKPGEGINPDDVLSLWDDCEEPLSPRELCIERLTNAINKYHNSQLTFNQVDNWVGSDDEIHNIEHYIDEVETEACDAVTPEEVMELN